MRNKTFPKEGSKKLNEINHELRGLLRRVEKERDFYKKEVENLVKPPRERKAQISKPEAGSAEWRLDFLRRFKKEVLGEK